MILTKCPKLFGKLLLLCTLQIFSENLKKKYVLLSGCTCHNFLTLSFKFKERYKHHKVPLDCLGIKQSGFIKKLHAAGSRVLELREQSEDLAMSRSIRFEQEVSKPSTNIIDQGDATGPDLDLLASLNEETLDDDDDDETDANTKLLAGKFVNFTDLLPPLPAKGNFKVEAIKSSQYFFS